MNNDIQYTQIGFQMAIIITLGAFGGKKLYEYFHTTTPVGQSYRLYYPSQPPCIWH
ncbi:MAG: hypothetical protein KatS3mg035_0508 [Bacteroidia bacterium]|nr:MAG: hypothetical protein KatS3mg035_0508 [Bacteroidia bacterium]